MVIKLQNKFLIDGVRQLLYLLSPLAAKHGKTPRRIVDPISALQTGNKVIYV